MSQIKVGTTVISTRSNTRYRVLEKNGAYAKVYIYHRLNSNGNRVKDMRITRLEWILENPCPIYQEKKSYTDEMLSVFKVGYKFRSFIKEMANMNVAIYLQNQEVLDLLIGEGEILEELGDMVKVSFKVYLDGVLYRSIQRLWYKRNLLYTKKLYEKYEKGSWKY